MMDRAQLENIVKSMDTGTLVDMLRTAGIHVQGVVGEDGQENTDMADDASSGRVEPFSEIKIPTQGEARGPINDPTTYLRDERQAQVSGTRPPQYMNQPTPDMEPWNAQTSQT
jgi:hypothetical protein